MFTHIRFHRISSPTIQIPELTREPLTPLSGMCGTSTTSMKNLITSSQAIPVMNILRKRTFDDISSFNKDRTKKTFIGPKLVTDKVASFESSSFHKVERMISTTSTVSSYAKAEEDEVLLGEDFEPGNWHVVSTWVSECTG